MKRILFVTGEYPPMQGGVADYTRELSLALMKLGQEVGIVTSVEAAATKVEPGLTVWTEIDRWGWGMWSRLDHIVRAWRPDVVHIQYQTAAYGMRPAINLWPWRPWRRPRALTAVTFHDLRQPYLFPKAHRARRWVTRTLAAHCDLVITTNPEDSETLRPLRPDLHEIPIGSNIADNPPPGYDRAAYRQRLGLAPDASLISYFGFLNASKGGEMLVDVLSQLVARGHDVHLLMIGGRVGASDPSNVAYLGAVEARIVEWGLADRVHWTGHIPAPEVSAAFRSADVCLLPYEDGASYRRGSFMAALAHGACIVTTTPQVPYPDLSDGDTLLLAPPGDADALARACERALTDLRLRRRLGEHARDLARHFTWDRIAETSLSAYHAIKIRHDSRP